jgi:hypothetical protein
MIYFTEPPTLDKAKPLTIGHVIASQVGMPPANFGPEKPNPYVQAAQSAYQNTKLAQADSQSSARNIMLSWFGPE